MAPSSPPVNPRPRRARCARSVLGCLTCRRRRVKCVVQKSPCHNCQSLNLTCTPSFHSNFKSWSPPGISQHNAESFETDSSLYPALPATPRTVQSEGAENAPKESGLLGEELPQDVLRWLSTTVSNGSIDAATPSDCSAHNRRVEAMKSHNTPLPDEDDWRQARRVSIESGYQLDISMYSNEISPTEVAMAPQSTVRNGIGLDLTNPVHYNENVEGLSDPFADPSFSFDLSSMWNIPAQINQVYGNSHGDIPFLSQYESNMPNLLTAKTTPWNPFSYMLNSTRDCPESPLRHGILSWTCCYLSCRGQSPPYSGAAYYAASSNAIRNIISEFDTDLRLPHFSSKLSETSEKLYMLLSTAYFLSQCDIMLCDYKSLYDRLDSIRDLFEEHWGKLYRCMNTLDRRLLTWLAYLDLRSSLFGNQRYRREGHSKQRDLISVLNGLDGLSSLRVVSRGQSYLSACYGESYPSTELQDDLRQEPCHMKCDDVLAIFSSLNSFETWNDEHPPAAADSMVEELRSAKIQAIRANLSRVRAECTILFSPSFSTDKDGVDRTAFHALTVVALHLSATILLNRILMPNIRTDPESQDAARQIIHISYRLRKAKYLESPRSLLWPLPLFIAGIESTDEIYQDWILSYLTELQHWGGYIKKSKALLEEICKRQQLEDKRVRVKEAMDDLNMTIIV